MDSNVSRLSVAVPKSFWHTLSILGLVLTPLVALLALLASPSTTAQAASGGNLWLTGHDADFHCSGGVSQCHYLQVAVNFARNGSSKPLLVLDHGGEVATALSSAFSGSPPPSTVVDPRSGFAGVALQDGSGNPLFSAIIVASDTTCGGCDNNDGSGITPDSNAINARTAAIASFFNAGGGILALAGAQNRGVYYQFIPIPATGVSVAGPFTFTPLGLSLGLVEGPDDNCCPTHNSFSLPAAGSPLQVAETDSKGLAETLIARGATVCGGSLCGGSGPAVPTPGPAVGCIQGKVLFQNTGAPAGGLQVKLTDTPLSTTTDSGGNFQFSGINVGGGYGGGPSYGVAVTPPAGYTMVGAPRVMVTLTAMGHCDLVTLNLTNGTPAASTPTAAPATPTSAATAAPTTPVPSRTPTPTVSATLPQKLPSTGGGRQDSGLALGTALGLLLVAGAAARRLLARS